MPDLCQNHNMAQLCGCCGSNLYLRHETSQRSPTGKPTLSRPLLEARNLFRTGLLVGLTGNTGSSRIRRPALATRFWFETCHGHAKSQRPWAAVPVIGPAASCKKTQYLFTSWLQLAQLEFHASVGQSRTQDPSGDTLLLTVEPMSGLHHLYFEGVDAPEPVTYLAFELVCAREKTILLAHCAGTVRLQNYQWFGKQGWRSSRRSGPFVVSMVAAGIT